MYTLPRKFVALLLAIWLPLFSGNALAAAVVIQTMNGDCHGMVVQSDEYQSPQLAANQDQSAGHDAQQNSPRKDCGVCYFACCGYMTAVSINVAEAQSLAQTFTLFSTPFQSITLPRFDPPPIARA
jgi:hypothetical protein